jgi:hypothetical protein
MAGTVDSFMALGSAIYTRLAAPLGSAIYDVNAKQGGTPPYTVWQVLTTTDEYTFNTTSEELEVQLRVVSNRKWPAEAKRVYGTVHNYMQDAPLSVTGFTVLRCRRTDKFLYADPEGFWHVGGVYTISLQAT